MALEESTGDRWLSRTAVGRITYLSCPAIHHKRISTTNLLERSFLGERRRT
jgi:hypothetical protein